MSASRPEQTQELLRNVTKPSLSKICARQGYDQLLDNNPRESRYGSARPLVAQPHIDDERENRSWQRDALVPPAQEIEGRTGREWSSFVATTTN